MADLILKHGHVVGDMFEGQGERVANGRMATA